MREAKAQARAGAAHRQCGVALIRNLAKPYQPHYKMQKQQGLVVEGTLVAVGLGSPPSCTHWPSKRLTICNLYSLNKGQPG